MGRSEAKGGSYAGGRRLSLAREKTQGSVGLVGGTAAEPVDAIFTIQAFDGADLRRTSGVEFECADLARGERFGGGNRRFGDGRSTADRASIDGRTLDAGIGRRERVPIRRSNANGTGGRPCERFAFEQSLGRRTGASFEGRWCRA